MRQFIPGSIENSDNYNAIKNFLEKQVEIYNTPTFIEKDPISVPHRFSKIQDIEIAGFFAAIFSWGQRVTIIKKTNFLINLMDEAPYDFVKNFEAKDLKPFLSFKHRTFNATDLLYTLQFLQYHYQKYSTLETAFSRFFKGKSTEMKELLTGFHRYFFSLPDFPLRTRKHIATPQRKSACKRLNMYLRWMVRQDSQGVDFGIWKQISPRQLICPLDVHLGRVARALGLLTRKQNDWQAAEELTNSLRAFRPEDPVIFDYALFGSGVARVC